MALESGKYTIISKLGDDSVGRRIAEDFSLNPKGIFKLPKDIGLRVTIWDAEKLENGNYKFKASGSIVGAIDGLLWALLQESQIETASTVEWSLKQDERDKDGNSYVVLAAGQQVGWAAPAAEDEQIAIKPILVGLTFPPTYAPSDVFVFKKWEQETE